MNSDVRGASKLKHRVDTLDTSVLQSPGLHWANTGQDTRL